MRAKFNDKEDKFYEFEGQCVMYKRVCQICGTKFRDEDLTCRVCGAARPRCRNHAMPGDEVCRMHSSGRPYSLYTKLAATLTDTSLEEFIEKDSRDLEQEYALAKVALSGALDNQKVTSKELMGLVKNFFEIANRKKEIESGQTLNISWNDELVNTLRNRVRKILKCFVDVVNEKVKDEDLRKEILLEVKNRTKFLGNTLTSPTKEGDYLKEEN